MIRYILLKCSVIIVILGYSFGLCFAQGLTGAALLDSLTTLGLSIWAYMILSSLLEEIMVHRRTLKSKFLTYEMLFFASLALTTVAFLSNSFAIALTALIVAAVAFLVGFGIYVWCLGLENEFVSSRIEALQYILWYLTDVRKNPAEWDEEHLVDHMSRFLRYYPRRMRLESGLNVHHAIDRAKGYRTVTEIFEEDGPESADALEAVEQLHVIAREYIERRNAEPVKEKKAKQKKKNKEAK